MSTDRLARISDAMAATLQEHAEAQGDERCVILLSSGNQGGIKLVGYEDDSDAAYDLAAYLAAMLEERGLQLSIAPVAS
jgi:hypothetical protein